MNTTNTQIRIATILVISLFFLWGLSYGLIDVMNKNFQNHLHITQHESGYLQMVYFGAYFIIALPAGFIAQRFSYKIGILMGLLLYAIGCLLVIPATNMAEFQSFLIAFFILACGLGTLETNANSYITKLGDDKNASFRINVAQSFNGLGSFIGPILASHLFLSITKPSEHASKEEIESLLLQNMGNVQLVYVIIACIVMCIALAFMCIKLPERKNKQDSMEVAHDMALKSHNGCLKRKHFNLGFIAQFLYIAAQVGAGAFFINYCLEHDKTLSDSKASYYFSAALLCFTLGRILTTPLMKIVSVNKILGIYNFINVLICIYLYFGDGFSSVIALIAMFFFMSISFPTIFALATNHLPNHEVKFASSILIMSIVGGAIMPSIMGYVNDCFGTSVGYALLIPCFLYTSYYGFFGSKPH